MSRHILIVEDEKKIADLIRDYLVNDGFSVTWLDQGDTVLPHIRKQMPDLILLDLMLPGMNGIDVLKALRAFSRVPVIIVTSRVEEIDRILGLEIGADDYICKPFKPREVVARVKAVLRRSSPEQDSAIFQAGSVRMDDQTRQVTVSGLEISLTPSEYDLLATFIKNPNRVFSRTRLIQNTQGYTFDGYDRTIDSHIKNLRKKIAASLPGKEIIVSVYGVGYKLVPDS